MYDGDMEDKISPSRTIESGTTSICETDVEASHKITTEQSAVPAAFLATMPERPAIKPLPPLVLRELRMRNFGGLEDAEMSFAFASSGQAAHMTCLVGKNGLGKTTCLNAIQILFLNYSGYDEKRYREIMLKNVRNWHLMSPAELETADFEVTGVFYDPERQQEHTVSVTRLNGHTEHPEHIRERLQDFCFAARFDQELNLFQVTRSAWPLFQRFFSNVTGFNVEENSTHFSLGEDSKTDRHMKDFVLGFDVCKPSGKISHRQCSAGERKIAKCFSTILNKPSVPRIILIDNVTDHVDNSRHLPVIQALEDCFPDSQVVATCHSVPVQRNLPDRSKVIDLRFLYAGGLVEQQPWRMRFMDEVSDLLEKMEGAFPVPGQCTARERGVMARLRGLESLLGSDPAVSSEWASKNFYAMAQEAYVSIAYGYSFDFPVRIRNASPATPA